jgi:hypothetical protein
MLTCTTCGHQNGYDAITEAIQIRDRPPRKKTLMSKRQLKEERGSMSLSASSNKRTRLRASLVTPKCNTPTLAQQSVTPILSAASAPALLAKTSPLSPSYSDNPTRGNSTNNCNNHKKSKKQRQNTTATTTTATATAVPAQVREADATGKRRRRRKRGSLASNASQSPASLPSNLPTYSSLANTELSLRLSQHALAGSGGAGGSRPSTPSRLTSITGAEATRRRRRRRKTG